ncbi:hypothetical protein ACFFRR_010403 [Megaselia abdita]
MFASVLTAIDGIISASTTDIAPYEASSFLNGLACGMTLLITISEAMSDSAHRGRVSSLDSLGLTSGMFLYSVFNYIFFNVSWSVNFQLSQQLGVLAIVFSVLAFILSFKAVDSPISHLIESDECGAFQNVMDLNGEKCASFDTYNHFEELKNFVVDDRRLSGGQRIGQGILPFFEIATVRTFFTLSSTSPIFFLTWSSSVLNRTAFAIIIYGAVRMLAACLSQSILLDKLGRKPVLLLSTLFSGAAFILVGYFMMASYSINHITITLWLLVCSQFFAGLGQGVSSVYMTEAFAPHVKHLFVFLVLVVENIAVVVALHFTGYNFVQNLSYAIGGGFIISFLITLFFLPETKKMSLKDAMDRFSKCFSIGC